MGLTLNNQQSRILSCDSLKKVCVTNFPNVFNMQSVFMKHTDDLKYVCFLGDDCVASLSELN